MKPNYTSNTWAWLDELLVFYTTYYNDEQLYFHVVGPLLERILRDILRRENFKGKDLLSTYLETVSPCFHGYSIPPLPQELIDSFHEKFKDEPNYREPD